MGSRYIEDDFKRGWRMGYLHGQMDSEYDILADAPIVDIKNGDVMGVLSDDGGLVVAGPQLMALDGEYWLVKRTNGVRVPATRRIPVEVNQYSEVVEVRNELEVYPVEAGDYYLIEREAVDE